MTERKRYSCEYCRGGIPLDPTIEVIEVLPGEIMWECPRCGADVHAVPLAKMLGGIMVELGDDLTQAM